MVRLLPEQFGVWKYTNAGSKPDWCPLKPLPSKLDNEGWNDCIDTIWEKKMKITKYVWVSQGVKIGETFNKEEAYAYRDHANTDWEEYVQDCLDNYKPYIDNEIFVYEEEMEASEIKHEIKAECIYDQESDCFICSNCKSSALNTYRGLSTNSAYCPTCGACMSNNPIFKDGEFKY